MVCYTKSLKVNCIFMNLYKLIDLKFWFNLNPGPWQGIGHIILIIVGISIILGVIAKILVKLNKCNNVVIKRLINDFGSILLFFGIIGLFLWLFRQQFIPVFSARFWWVILVVITGIWKIRALLRAKTYKANKQKQDQKNQVYDKYLP